MNKPNYNDFTKDELKDIPRCEECGSLMYKTKEPRGEFWGIPVSEYVWVCPKCDR